MQKILIYGYGWSGQSAFALFSALGFLCKVTDERISSFNTSLESFLVLQQDVLREEFDVVLVCIVDNEIAREVKEKLIKQGIKEEKIRFFQNYIYKDKMLSLVKNYFGSAEEVLSEILAQDLTLPKLNEKLQALLQEYHTSRTNTQDALKLREEAKRQFEGQNLFSILYELSWKKASLDHISYPGFNVGISQYKREDKNFYFIKKIDFASLRNRKKDLKLVACFGNSALRCEYLPLEETISHYLQEKLGDEF